MFPTWHLARFGSFSVLMRSFASHPDLQSRPINTSIFHHDNSEPQEIPSLLSKLASIFHHDNSEPQEIPSLLSKLAPLSRKNPSFAIEDLLFLKHPIIASASALLW
jgi:hypothetical protein